MIQFRKLRYSNFLSVGNTPIEIDLQKSSATLVVGHNGAGKSSVLDALSFALFGKAHRNINKNQLINSINKKNTLVEVEFSVSGSNYLVRRGIKPNIFEIYKNQKLLNQESHSKDYQKILELNILKLNHKSFHQVVVLGSSNFIPFMQLAPYLRRMVIEDLLDISIFGKMSTILKDKTSDLKKEMKEIDNGISITQEKIAMQTNHITELKDIELKIATNTEKKIKDIESEIELLQKRNFGLQTKYDNEFGSVENLLNVSMQKINELTEEKTKLTHKASKVAKDVMFYDKNDACPTCSQKIDDSLRQNKITEMKDEAKVVFHKITETDETLSKLKLEHQEIFKKWQNLNDCQFDIRTNNSQITLLEKQLKGYAKNESSNQESIDGAKQFLYDLKDTNNKLIEKSQAKFLERRYHDAMAELLKDTGIKAKIIREYLPTMNTLINKYLNILDFFVLFQLDENFSETIKSRHRDEFTYASFSEGEKQRIDLALLFAWRQIAKIKNSANTNLLILDETFDSSLDADGVDNLLKILYTLKGDSNIFVISHKQDLLDGKFPDKIEFEKRGNFTFRK